MSIGSWLKGATRIRFDDRTLSNVLRTGGMLGGAAIGGPAGLALAAGTSAAGRGISKGANFGNILGAGVKGAATAGGLRAGAGLLKNAVSGAGAGGSGPVALGGGGGAPAAIPPAGGLAPITAGAGAPASVLGAPVSSAANLTTAAQSQPGVFRSALNTAGSFVKDNPTAVGMSLQGAGGLATAGSENRMNDAQARILEQRADETEFDFMQRKQRDAALAPLWSQLGSTFNANNNAIAANPYAPRAG